jgi:hypothetical protein
MRQPGIRAIARRLHRVGLRQCSCCRRVLVLRAFYRRSLGCEVNPGGIFGECKTCHNGRTDAWREAHPERYREIQRKAHRKFAKKAKAARA